MPRADVASFLAPNRGRYHARLHVRLDLFLTALTIAVVAVLMRANAHAQSTSSWIGLGGSTSNPLSGNWSVSGNWSPSGVPQSNSGTVLTFGGSGSTPYVSTDDLTSNQDPFKFATINLNSAASVSETIAPAATQSLDIGAGATISQNNSGAFTISLPISTSNSNNSAANVLTLAGTGTGTVTLSGAITDASTTKRVGITQTGSGTFVLSSNTNTYSGGTSVTAGTLLVTNTAGSGTGTGSVTVTNAGTTFGGGTLTGTGGISGSLSIGAGANLRPGSSAHDTAILATGALTLASTSNFLVDLNGAGSTAGTSTTAGSNYDQVKATGGVSLNGSNLVLTLGTTFTAANVGQTFSIISNVSSGAITGTFAGLTEGATFNVGIDTFQISYAGSAGDGTAGNDVVLTLKSVPEPSTWVGASLVVLVIGYQFSVTRRKRARALARVID